MDSFHTHASCNMHCAQSSFPRDEKWRNSLPIFHKLDTNSWNTWWTYFWNLRNRWWLSRSIFFKCLEFIYSWSWLDPGMAKQERWLSSIFLPPRPPAWLPLCLPDWLADWEQITAFLLASVLDCLLTVWLTDRRTTSKRNSCLQYVNLSVRLIDVWLTACLQVS